jgi:hypothetical protein
MINVINIKDAPVGWRDDPHYVYIGRAGKGLDGYFGNPFIAKQRGDTLDKYRGYLEDLLKVDREFIRRTKALQGKTLVCFCKPKRCHGDILAHYAEKL